MGAEKEEEWKGLQYGNVGQGKKILAALYAHLKQRPNDSLPHNFIAARVYCLTITLIKNGLGLIPFLLSRVGVADEEVDVYVAGRVAKERVCMLPTKLEAATGMRVITLEAENTTDR
ncbi:unnamed protein product [Clonostachys rosea]|uniref:Uncharacterized protein n=1 Tax=Bionectria ochroleuca TaxID=29856 RepID=A0ABY6V437_BIOOC|nr:unnamed protein product [Clonostachys rosea]